ncbi:cytochrome P450 1A1-like [Dermacentor albipictus]|uniref:cytochrome P450 1A1-like n=1 Tax=Dermacentor albipictus TaxID=60249 RepID=UPI0031FDD595
MFNLNTSAQANSCIVIGFASLFIWHVVRFYRNVSRHPRGPFPWPIVGNLLAVGARKHFKESILAWTDKYGEVFTFWMGEKPVVVLGSHAIVKEAFIAKRNSFGGRPPCNMGAMHKQQGDHDIIFEDANLTWKALRKVALAAVRKHTSSENLEVLCCDVVDAYVNSLHGEMVTVKARDPLLFIIFNITAASTFSTKFDVNSPDLLQLANINRGLPDMSPLQSDIAPWLGVLQWRLERSFCRHMNELLALFSRLYDKTKDEYVQGKELNFVHAILAAREEAIEQDKNDAIYLTERNMMQIALNLFEAGLNTSVSAADWLLLELVRNPDIQRKVQSEIDTVIGERRPTKEDSDRLPFTVACILEVLRLYPPALLGLPRRVQNDEWLGGVLIPRNAIVLYNIFKSGRDPSLWEDPLSFKPQRFLDALTGALSTKDKSALLSFGLGARRCVAEKLVPTILFYVLVRLMQRTTWSLPPGEVYDPTRTDGTTLLLAPADRRVIVAKRMK